ncbi:hypothetical protein BH23GEM10_BH23GEM10_06800 [soil metagenome]
MTRTPESGLKARAGKAADGDGVDAAPPLPKAEIADLFATLDKAVRAQRMYQPNNPVYQGFIASARKAFAGVWNRISTLPAAVEENGFRCYGSTHVAGEGRDSLSFLFYKDGIRFITFLPGFEDEVEKFLAVVNRGRSQDRSTDDDMVTLLWREEFDAFQYSYVDALAEGLQVPQSKVPKLAGMELTLVPDGETGGPRPDSPPPPAVEAGEPTVAGLINRDDFEETLYFLEPSELVRLHDEVELEWHRDVKRDVLNALFDRLEEGMPAWRTEILRILRQMLPSFLSAGDLSSATRILVELNAILDAGTLDAEHREDAELLFRELSEPGVLAQLLRSLEHGGIDAAGTELGIFLKHLGPAAMPVLLSSIERSEAGPLKDRLRGAMEGLAAAHRAELIALIGHRDPDVVRGAVRLAGQLGTNEGVAPISKLLDQPDASIRRVAAAALVRIRNAPALDVLVRALGDSDRDVRVTAARGIASVRYPPARARLEELIDGPIVRDADLTEKLAFFEAFGSVAAADSIGRLDRMLNGRRLLKKEAPEMRACAAMALGRVGSPAARACLQRAADESNAVVRNAVQKALRQESA